MSTTDSDDDDESEAPTEEDDLEPSLAEKPAPPRNVAFLLVSIAAGVFALLAIVMVAIVVKDRSKTDTGNGDRTEISTTAARMAEAISGVDPAGNAAFVATVQQLGTAPVVAQYNEISDALRKAMGPLKLQSIRGSVKEVYVGDINQSEVRVIVRLDLIYVGNNTRVIPDQYLDLSLAKLDGVWKVDNLQALNVTLAGGGTTPTIPGASTSTTAPSSASAPPPSS